MSEMKELEALIPTPVYINAIGTDTRLRVQPLTLKQLAEVVKFIQGSKEVLGDLENVKTLDIATLLQGPVVKRANGLLRLLLPTHAKEMNDEWCAEHLSTAHYKAIVVASMKQNALYDVFLKAKGFLAAFMEKNMDKALRIGKEKPSA